MEDVKAAVQRTYARDIIVITDACHSAGVGGQAALRDVGLNQINQRFLQQLEAATGGIAVFTASEANQFSEEGEEWGGGHGVFTWTMLEALRGKADEDGDRIVTLGEMMEYVRDRVRRATRNAQIPTIGQTAFDRAWPIALVLDEPVVAARPAPIPEPVPVPATIEVSARTAEVREGETLRMNAVVRTASGEVLSDEPVLWTSSDEAVAVVDTAGNVRAVAAGTAVIRAATGDATGRFHLRVLPVVAEIVLERAEIELQVGDSARLSAVPRATDGTVLDRPLKWSTAETATVTVSEAGEVRAVAPGEAVVTVTSEAVSADVVVRVRGPVASPVVSIVLGDSVLELEVGERRPLTAWPIAANDSVVAGRRVDWSSSDPTVLSVDSAGVLHARAVGRVTVTAQVNEAETSARAFVLPPTYAVGGVFMGSLLIPGSGEFRTGHLGRGILTLAGVAAAVGLGVGIEEVHIDCAAPPQNGVCPDHAILDRSVTKPYLLYGIGAAAAVTLIAAIDAAVSASGWNRQAAELRARWMPEALQEVGLRGSVSALGNGKPALVMTINVPTGTRR